MIIIVRLILKNPSKLRAAIMLKGFSQSEYANHIGIDKSYLSYIINRRRNPAPPTARKIAKGIGKKIPDLFLTKMLSKDSKKEND